MRNQPSWRKGKKWLRNNASPFLVARSQPFGSNAASSTGIAADLHKGEREHGLIMELLPQRTFRATVFDREQTGGDVQG